MTNMHVLFTITITDALTIMLHIINIMNIVEELYKPTYYCASFCLEKRRAIPFYTFLRDTFLPVNN